MTKIVTLIISPSNEESRGARHRPCLGDEILAFVYPVSTRRVFTTVSCPALRIVAIDDKKGTTLFDKVIQPSKFVDLPVTRLVLEMDPGVDYSDVLPDILAAMDRKTGKLVGEVEQEITASPLIFALFADALADLRRVKETCIVAGEVDAGKLKGRFAAWERGKILGSAGFVVDYSSAVTWRIPHGAIDLSHEIIYIEKDYHHELLAASIAGIPWQTDFPNKCLRCERGGSWRFALPIPPGMPCEISWRLQRPENAVPLCRDCADKMKFCSNEALRRDLASGLWGARFDALERWYLAFQNLDGYSFPKDWLRETHPLWPQEFGGYDWCSGSGETKDCAAREPKNVRRTPEQQKILASLGIQP